MTNSTPTLVVARVETPAHIEEVRDLLREYTSAAIQAFGSADAPSFVGLEHELATLPGVYAPPDGRLLLATLEGRPAGCGGLRRHDPTTGEVKRLYVRPGFRGHRIGERIVSELIAAAREVGYRRLVLDSHVTMTRAQELYRAAGFRFVDAPPDFPDRLRSVVVFMEMDLV